MIQWGTVETVSYWNGCHHKRERLQSEVENHNKRDIWKMTVFVFPFEMIWKTDFPFKEIIWFENINFLLIFYFKTLSSDCLYLCDKIYVSDL